jgi:hypothetical protein
MWRKTAWKYRPVVIFCAGQLRPIQNSVGEIRTL